MNLHEIANSGSFGSGKRVRDRLAAVIHRILRFIGITIED